MTKKNRILFLSLFYSILNLHNIDNTFKFNILILLTLNNKLLTIDMLNFNIIRLSLLLLLYY